MTRTHRSQPGPLHRRVLSRRRGDTGLTYGRVSGKGGRTPGLEDEVGPGTSVGKRLQGWRKRNPEQFPSENHDDCFDDPFELNVSVVQAHQRVVRRGSSRRSTGVSTRTTDHVSPTGLSTQLPHVRICLPLPYLSQWNLL